MDKKWKKTEPLIKLDLPWDRGAPQLAGFPEKLVDVKEPIWKKPEGMTFEDAEELKPGDVGIVAVPLEPDGRVTLVALLKDPAKKRAGRRG